MKNSFIFKIFFIFWFLSLSLQTQAFFGEQAGLDLYKNLDKNFSSTTSNWFQTQLAGTSPTIKDKINELINQQAILNNHEYKDCISGDLAPSQLEAISQWNLKILYEKISNNCKNSSWKIENATINFIQKIIREHYNNAFIVAQKEVEVIWDISSLWIYSDWDLENSTFDLMDDLEKINDIIFASKFQYNWTQNGNFLDYLEKINEDKKQEIIQNTNDKSVLQEFNTWEKAYQEDTWWNFLENLLQSWNTNSNICIDPSTWNHWLDVSFLEDFTVWNFQDDFSEDLQNLENNITSSWANNQNLATQITGDYQWVNDNSLWPCDSFYCITVNFKTYNHQLLGWWDNITIEYLIDRSNQHLSRFANASLIPAKMTTNNFELWLSNLNLSELFHMSFQIQTKPVPILSLEKSQEDKKNEDKYSSNALLEKYYKAYGLDYTRRNDLHNFTKYKQEIASVIQSTDSQITDSFDRIEKLESFMNGKKSEVNIIKKDISEKFTQKNLEELHSQLIEINNFTKSITQYSQTLWDLIVAMDKIKNAN